MANTPRDKGPQKIGYAAAEYVLCLAMIAVGAMATLHALNDVVMDKLALDLSGAHVFASDARARSSSAERRNDNAQIENGSISAEVSR